MMAPTARSAIYDIAPYVGGASAIEGRDQVIRLASNENPLGAGTAAVDAYRAAGDSLFRYPDGGATALRQAIAEVHGLPADQIVCGAGSDELIALLVRAYAGPGDEVLYSEHGFLMYPITARTQGAVPVQAPERNLRSDVDALLAAVTPRTRLLFLANPNNPTGSYLSRDELEALARELPDEVLLVIDAAYAEYVEAADYSDGNELVDRHPNVVVTRTFSKIYGLAALRLGWAYAAPEVIDILNRVRGPFNVSAAAQIAGEAAVRDREHVARSIAHNSRWRTWFTEQLARLNLRAEPSVANFVIVRFADAAGAAEHLKQNGILVRQMAAYGLPDHLRITIGTEDDMRAVIDALSNYEQ
ncbi:histidinol-phosphate transaminase [Fodinicurvata halophila]|uniref:Histidinol-phosphate aminotransferase n=1 Tax=Fodinicurvata halophila TaxID=1419723 RepID=A0ABV8UPN0_9PROT